MYASLGQLGAVVSINDFYAVCERVSLQDADFTSDTYKPGSTGQAELFRRLRHEVGL
jgi:hypothetical protein